jgi:poly-gamma-glutamate synthesis protein (capsule biosynthesis protein)
MSGITFLGDVMLGRGVARCTSPADLKRTLQQLIGDRRLVINLECCVTDERTPAAHAHSGFIAAPELLSAVREAGAVAASVANNHSLDFGERGFTDTIEALKDSGIQPIGSRHDGAATTCLSLGEQRIRLISACALTLPAIFWKSGVLSPRDDAFLQAIADAVDAGEVVVVSIHWGHEGITIPPPEVRTLARRLAQLGVRLVIGHGPHVVQGVEQIDDCTVYYSLGDAIFDRPDVEDRSWSLQVDVDLHDDELVIQRRPFVIDRTTFTPRANAGLKLQALVEQRSAVLRDEASYRRLFAREAGQGFLGQQVRSTLRLVRRSGLRGLAAKASGMRLRHLKLLGLSVRQLVKRT